MRIFILSAFTFIGLAWLPYIPSNSISIFVHELFAWSTSVLFTIGMYVLAKNSKDKVIYNMTVITIILSGILTVIFIMLPKGSDLIFISEVGSWLIMQIWMLWISYYTRLPIVK